MIKRILDSDKFIQKLNAVYQDSMTELCIMPLGIENWMNQVSLTVDMDNPPAYSPKAKHEKWLAEIDTLREKNDLASVIKVLTLICEHYEEDKIDILHTKCYRKTLGYLVLMYNLLNSEAPIEY
jgi:hypothetical protein